MGHVPHLKGLPQRPQDEPCLSHGAIIQVIGAFYD